MRKALVAFSILSLSVLTIALATTTARAAQTGLPLTALEGPANLLENADYHYRHHCVRQYFTCRDRWGGGAGFRRCMRWRGCWDAYVRFRERREERRRDRYEDHDDDDYERDDRGQVYSCGHWRNACAQNWGYGNNDYYGCLRYHGCE